MAVTITDTTQSAATLSMATATIQSSATLTSEEIDRGANTQVSPVTGLLTVTGFAAAPAAGGYMAVYIVPLSGTGGTLFSDATGPAVVPVTADALYNAPVTLQWPPGARYAKAIVGNKSSQNTDANAVSLTLMYQAVTV